MVGDGSKRSEASTIPPRKINVQKFAESRSSELQTLHSIVSDRLNNDFRSRRNKRRRTTSYDNQAKKKYRKKRKLGEKNNVVDSEKVKDKVLPRHIRRRLELKRNLESGFSTSGDGTKRLRTHVWHAKRFTMTKLWGFHLPLGLQGRGRGSRALSKWYKNGSLVHDASYCTAVQLEGPEESLISVLSMVLEPSPSAHPDEVTKDVLSGVIYGTAMLHHVAAPVSELIAPVTYMWRPSHLCNEENCDNDNNSNECNKPLSSGTCSPHRQLWVWIHGSAFSQGYVALKFASQKQMSESGMLINCFSLEGQLAKLELMGSKAFQLIQNVLQPVDCKLKNSWAMKRCSVNEAEPVSGLKKSIVDNEEDIPSRSVLYFTAMDPRALPEKKIVVVPFVTPALANCISEDELGKDVTTPRSLEKSRELLSPACSKLEGHSSFSDERSLWDASSRISKPVEENVHCMEKHHLRMDFICLDDKKSRMLGASTEVQGSRSCAVVLLKNSNKTGSFMGWSLILPLCWVKVFWIPFISKGAHAIGLREKRWISCDVRLPSFPSDFPDCNAYSSFMASEAAALEEKAERLRPAVRPMKLPIPPPWDSVRVTVDKGYISEQPAPDSTAKDMIGYLSLNSRDSDSLTTSPLRVKDNSFDGIVARTYSVLVDFLNEISSRLLVFPQVPSMEPSLLEVMKDESKLCQFQNVPQITCGRKLCFVRVLLHAYKKGFFEEGAVVCAPCLSDVTLWTLRSENDEAGFQIPESSVSSYFKEQSSGKWELQIPEESPARESHRWPIGFITAGFVRGSKKLVAEALCEVSLLARLREELWKEIPVNDRRKEIYVLVRNLRSSAYRLALASIALEQQEEDVEFL